MAGTAPVPRRQSPIAMRPAHALPTRIATIAICFHLTTIFALPAANFHSKHFIVCQRPNLYTCVAWPLRLDNFADVPKQYYLATGLNCVVSNLQNKRTPGRFGTVKITNERQIGILCKALHIIPMDMPIDILNARTRRVRRHNGYLARGRYRGQTQSQYLSIDHGNKKDEGKAEAHSAADSSRAIVSGNSGMGQAQSQTVFYPTCEDCLSQSKLDAENNSYKPVQARNTESNPPEGISQSVYGPLSNNGAPNPYMIANRQFPQPGGTNSRLPTQNQSPGNILTGAPNTPGGLIETTHQPGGTSVSGQTTYPPSGSSNQPGNILTNQSPTGRIASGGQILPPGNIMTSPQNLPNRNGIINQQPGFLNGPSNQASIPGNTIANNPLQQNGHIPGVDGFNTLNPGVVGSRQPSTPGNMFNQPGNLMTNTPTGSHDSNFIFVPRNGLNTNSGNIPGTSSTIPGGQSNVAPNISTRLGSNQAGFPNRAFPNNGPINSNIAQSLLEPGGFSTPTGNLNNIIGETGLQPSNNDGQNAPFIAQGNGPNWPLLSSLLPATGARSTYYCCVVSPGNSQSQMGQNYYLAQPYNYVTEQRNKEQNSFPNAQSVGSVPNSPPGISHHNVPYTNQQTLSNLGQQFTPHHNSQNTGYIEPTGTFSPNSNTRQLSTNIGQYGNNIPTDQYGQIPTQNNNAQYTPGQNSLQNSGTFGNVPYENTNSGSNNIQTPGRSYNNAGTSGTNGLYTPGGSMQNTPPANEILNNGMYSPGGTTHNTMPVNSLYGSIRQSPYGSDNSQPTSNGPYGQMGKGQTISYPGNIGVESSSTNGPGQNMLPSANFPYNTGRTNNPGQNVLSLSYTPYGTGNTGSNIPGQNISPISNIPSSASNIGGDPSGQSPMPSSNLPYSTGSVGTNIPGQNLLTSSNIPFGLPNAGGNTPSLNMLTSSIPPYGPGNTATNVALSPAVTNQNTPYIPNEGTNTMLYPNGYGLDNGKSTMQYPNTIYDQNNLQYPQQYPSTSIPALNNILNPNGATNYQKPNGYNQQPGSNSANGFSGQQLSGVNNENGGIPQNVVDSNSITNFIDEYNSEAQASVSQAINGTTAVASSKGGNEKGRAQTQVEGTYAGTGSFSANAEISDDNKAAQSHVSGDKKGASSSAEGRGRKNKSQASVKLGSETGSIITDSQSSGDMHSSNSQVQGSVKGGMADAQAKGPGSTSSQAQIGFTPYKKSDNKAHDSLKTPFEGAGTSSAQTSGRLGTSQSQLRGMFKYGITYNGAAQSGSSLDKDAVFSNLLPFEKINVFDENNKNINVDITTENSSVIVSSTNYYDETTIINQESSTDNQILEHSHSDHHKSDSQQNKTNKPLLEGNRRSFQPNYRADYEYGTDKEDNQQDYDVDDGFGTENGQEHNDYTNYDDINRETEPTHQSLQTRNKKELEVQQSTRGNTQHIILGSLNNHDAKIVQRNSEHPDESKVYQPGERVPGMDGYSIPVGFTGSVKSVASKDKTYAVGSKSSPSQAQTVTLTSGTGKVKYVYPYSKNVNAKDLRSLYNSKPDENRYMSVSKSVTRDLDNENNIRRQYSHTYYTKSSSCGYFTFTCTIVSSSEGKKKVCKPKIPTNPDGSPMKC
ncbi:hypothetical protein ACJJTC_000705 [Scirpophaga incertulas]